MQYRREIDGLRAIAVLPVILFHAGITTFGGGYIGVDVFFVISGYLITGIILNDLQQKTFSLAQFYERRARRILPALFLVILVCIPFAWKWMLPLQYKDFSQSLVAVTLFASNILFWRKGDYFASSSDEKPLLHTWSLAVEEQYYLFFPVFLILLWRFGRNPTFYAIVFISAISLTLSEWGWRTHPNANFYLAPTRAWELFAGAICAFLQFEKPRKDNNLFAILGIGMILFSIFYYNDQVPFPSLYALVPVIGTALVLLYAGKSTWVAKSLSLGIFTGIGLISYSAYLWHQPLFAFARIHSIHPPEKWMMLLLAALSLILAYFSWRFVEQPFRQNGFPSKPFRKSALVLAITTGTVLISFGMYGHIQNGVPQRLEPKAQYYASFYNSRNPYNKCMLLVGDNVAAHPLEGCQDFLSGDRIDVLFVGDSHSHFLSYQAQLVLQKAGISSYSVAYVGCIGLEGYFQPDLPNSHECDGYNRHIIDFARKSGIKTIVITSRFTLYWSGLYFDNQEGGVEGGEISYVDLQEFRNENAGPEDADRMARVLKSYADKIKNLADEFNVVLVYPIPEAGWNVPQLAAKKIHIGHEKDVESISTSYQLFQNRNGPVISVFDTIQHPNLYRIKPHQVMCDTFIPGRCVNLKDGISYYFDDDHLSNAGAGLIAPYIVEQVKNIMKNQILPAENEAPEN